MLFAPPLDAAATANTSSAAHDDMDYDMDTMTGSLFAEGPGLDTTKKREVQEDDDYD